MRKDKVVLKEVVEERGGRIEKKARTAGILKRKREKWRGEKKIKQIKKTDLLNIREKKTVQEKNTAEER